MVKTVAIQNGLGELAETLRRNGCRVVGVDQTGYPLSALVYSTNLDVENFSPTTMEIQSGADDNGYVLMLNAGEMDTDEIVDRINRI